MTFLCWGLSGFKEKKRKDHKKKLIRDCNKISFFSTQIFTCFIVIYISGPSIKKQYNFMINNEKIQVAAILLLLRVFNDKK